MFSTSNEARFPDDVCPGDGPFFVEEIVMAAYIVTFQPSGRRCAGNAGESLMDIVRRGGVDLMAACGGHGTCGRCKVRIESAAAAPWRIEDRQPFMNALSGDEKRLLSAYERSRGFRLACRTKLYGDAVVYVPYASTAGAQVILQAGQQREARLCPNVRFFELRMVPPSLHDFRSDFRRIVDGLQDRYPELFAGTEFTVDIRLLQTLPQVVRKEKWHVSVGVMAGQKIIFLGPVQSLMKYYGVSIDVGTTTLAAALVNLSDGKTVASSSRMNSQVRYGDDVISRISYAGTQEKGLEMLRAAVLRDINAMLTELAGKAGIGRENIFEAVLAGNTVMEHILLGICPEYIGKSPFAAAIHEALDVPAREAGILMAPGGNLHFLPMEAGFVGADNVAVLIAGETYLDSRMTLTVDIGTNGEINFGNDEKLYSTSCATGPALEGAQLSFGMRAAAGAVEHVRIYSGTYKAQCGIIGSTRARGICGSGIIDAVAEMVRAGILKKNGAFAKERAGSLVRKGARGQWEYVLVPAVETDIGIDITITQQDVRAVQLAKAALFAGAALLVARSGGRAVERIVLAGAFGSFIDKRNARAIGLLPDVADEAIEVVGNAAGEGARLALVSTVKRQEAVWVAKQVEFVEAAAEPLFQKYFLQGMDFCRMTISS